MTVINLSGQSCVSVIGMLKASPVGQSVISTYGTLISKIIPNPVGQSVISTYGILISEPKPTPTGIAVISTYGTLVHEPIKTLRGYAAISNYGIFNRAPNFIGQSTTAAAQYGGLVISEVIQKLSSLLINIQYNNITIPNDIKLVGNTLVANEGKLGIIGYFFGLPVTAHYGLPTFFKYSGLSLTATLGTLHKTLSPDIIGLHISADIGIFQYSQFGGLHVLSESGQFIHTISITGQTVHASEGILTIVIALAGNQVTSHYGKLLSEITLRGLSIVANLGHFSNNRIYDSVGLAINSHLGNLIDNLKPVVLGLDVVSAIHTLSVIKEYILGGNHVTSDLGDLNYRIRFTLIGELTTATEGLLISSRMEYLQGLLSNTHFGHFSPMDILALDGLSLSSHVDSFSYEILVKLIGLSVISKYNVPAKYIYKNIVGNTTTSDYGDLRNHFNVIVDGQSAITTLGDMKALMNKTLFGIVLHVLFNDIHIMTGSIAGLDATITAGDLGKLIYTDINTVMVRSINGVPYMAKTLVGNNVTSHYGIYYPHLIKSLMGVDITVGWGNLQKIPYLHGLFVDSIEGELRYNSHLLSGVGVVSDINNLVANVRLLHSLYVISTVASLIQRQDIDILLTGLVSNAQLGEFLSIFEGLYVKSSTGLLLPVITYPTYPNRNPPAYRLVSIHDILTGRTFDSDPTNSRDRRRSKYFEYID